MTEKMRLLRRYLHRLGYSVDCDQYIHQSGAYVTGHEIAHYGPCSAAYLARNRRNAHDC